MASLTYEQGKRTGYRLRVYTAAGRQSIWLGRIGEADATAILRHVEDILAAQTAELPISRITQRWLDAPENRELVAKLSAILGNAVTVGKAIDLFLDEKAGDVSESTLATLANSLEILRDAIGSQWMSTIDGGTMGELHSGIPGADSTRGKIASHWRQFFAWAIGRRYAVTNPAAELSTTIAVGKKTFIAAETVERILEATPDPHLRAVIALARWGGLRIPSELAALNTASIDRRQRRIKIDDVKRKRAREIPIFPELVPHLEAIATLSESELLSLSPSGLAERLLALLERCRIEPWPRLWHSLRATRETELIQRHGVVAACRWLGNSERVALKHYALIDDATWSAATASQKSGNQSGT